MFIRVETYIHLIPMWKTISYINLSNVLRLEVEHNYIKIYTIFRPKYSAYRINFASEEEARRFAEQTFARLPQNIPCLPVEHPTKVEKRYRQDEASPDELAMAVLEEYDTQKQLK